MKPLSALAAPAFASLALASLALASLALTQPGPARAQTPPGMAMALQPDGTADGAALMVAMSRMSTDMANVPMSGNADQDFAEMMLPHHQGAIDMANFELAHGKDPAMLELARNIVAAQDKEMAEMKTWLAGHSAAH